MAFTYGFYNSINDSQGNPDRVYDATDFSKLFSGIIKDGVIADYGEGLRLKPGTGRTVAVGKGRAWFNDTWTHNDSDFVLNISENHATLKRIDAIVLTIDKGHRINSFGVVTGTTANGGLGNNPTTPSISSGDSTLFNYLLGTVTLPPQSSAGSITQITSSMVATTIKNYASGLLQVISLDKSGQYSQWNAQFNEWFASLQSRFSDSDVNTINNRIDNIVNNGVSKLTTSRTIDGIYFNGTSAVKHYGVCSTASATPGKEVAISSFSLVTGAYVLVKFSNANTATLANLTLNVNGTGAKSIKYKGGTLPYQLEQSVYLFIFDGTNYELVSAGIGSATGNFVPISRTINNKALSSNITLTGEDIQSSTTSGRTITAAIDSKVDKVAGKVLSSWDLTTARKDKIDNCATQSTDGVMSAADKKKLDGIATGANNYVLPKATTNNIGGIGLSSYCNVWTSESGNPYLVLVDSTYDGLMRHTDKTKLDGIATGANKYVLPTASSSTLGGIKVGTNLSISNGVLSAKDTVYSLPTASSSTLGGIKVGSNLSISSGVLKVPYSMFVRERYSDDYHIETNSKGNGSATYTIGIGKDGYYPIAIVGFTVSTPLFFYKLTLTDMTSGSGHINIGLRVNNADTNSVYESSGGSGFEVFVLWVKI